MTDTQQSSGLIKMDLTVLDCPDPRTLGAFYTRILGWRADPDDTDDDWVTIRPDGGGSGLAFQRVEGHQPPTWPEGERPQQFHLDLVVDDIDAAEPTVLGAGGTVSRTQPSETGGFRVYLDPAGHPFCLVSKG